MLWTWKHWSRCQKLVEYLSFYMKYLDLHLKENLIRQTSFLWRKPSQKPASFRDKMYSFHIMANVWIYGRIKHISRYEFTLAAGFGMWPFGVLKSTLQTFYHTNIGYLRNWQTFIIVSGIVSMVYCYVNSCFNYLWIYILGFFPPIPFGGFITGFFCIPVLYATLWFRQRT